MCLIAISTNLGSSTITDQVGFKLTKIVSKSVIIKSLMSLCVTGAFGEIATNFVRFLYIFAFFVRIFSLVSGVGFGSVFISR